MRRRRMVLLLVAGGCFFPDVSSLDTNADGGGVDSGLDAPADALADVMADVGVIPDVMVPSCDGACGAPLGFAPVLFALDQSTSCPQGTTTLNGAADPSIGGACACDCKVTQPPSCVPMVLYHDLGDTPGACSSLSSFAPVLDAGCFSAPGTGLHAYWSISPPPVTAPGACTGTPASDPSAASAKASRLCLASTCQATCGSTPGFESCFVASGNLACPNGLTAHHVGNVAVACGACTGCSVDGGCGGTVTLYTDTACSTVLSSIGVDGGCTATDGTSFSSVRYTPAIVGETCTPGTATGTVSLSEELTVCCP